MALMIRAIAASFQLAPPNRFTLSPAVADLIIRVTGDMFLIGLKIAAPIMIALFLSNLGLGIVARTVPQVNILMVGFPINIGIGLVLFGFVLRNASPLLIDLSKGMGELIIRLLRMV